MANYIYMLFFSGALIVPLVMDESHRYKVCRAE